MQRQSCQEMLLVVAEVVQVVWAVGQVGGRAASHPQRAMLSLCAPGEGAHVQMLIFSFLKIELKELLPVWQLS